MATKRRKLASGKKHVNLNLSVEAIKCIEQVAEATGASSLSAAVEQTMREKALIITAAAAAAASATPPD